MAPGQTFSLRGRPRGRVTGCFTAMTTYTSCRSCPFDGTAAASRIIEHSHEGSMDHMMAGPVMGITVNGRSTERVSSIGRRRISASLPVSMRAARPMNRPSATRCMKGATFRRLPRLTCRSDILLKRAQPVSITVDNQLPEPTSVHWHGIELESYYDGVPDLPVRAGGSLRQSRPGKTSRRGSLRRDRARSSITRTWMKSGSSGLVSLVPCSCWTTLRATIQSTTG